MKTYQIFDNNERCLMMELPIFHANRPIEALKKYLAMRNEIVNVKISADNDVRFGVIPSIIENGSVFQVGGKRKTWFKVIV